MKQKMIFFAVALMGLLAGSQMSYGSLYGDCNAEAVVAFDNDWSLEGDLDLTTDGELGSAKGGAIVTIVCWILIGLAAIFCFVNRFNAPLLAFIALLVFKFFGAGGVLVSWVAVILSALIVVVSMFLNQRLQEYVAKLHEFGKGGKWGATIGSLVGVLLFINMDASSMVSIIFSIILFMGVCPFVGAYVGEFITRKNLKAALAPAGTAYISYLGTTIVKLAAVALTVYFVLKAS